VDVGPRQILTFSRFKQNNFQICFEASLNLILQTILTNLEKSIQNLICHSKKTIQTIFKSFLELNSKTLLKLFLKYILITIFKSKIYF
jgi:hypothetical protein